MLASVQVRDPQGFGKPPLNNHHHTTNDCRILSNKKNNNKKAVLIKIKTSNSKSLSVALHYKLVMHLNVQYCGVGFVLSRAMCSNHGEPRVLDLELYTLENKRVPSATRKIRQ